MDGIWQCLIFIFIFLILCIINNTRRFIAEHLSEVLSGIAGIGFTIADIKADNEDIFTGQYTWKEASPILLIISIVLLATGIYFNYKRNIKESRFRELESSNKTLEKKIERIKAEYYRLCSDNLLWLFKSFFSTGNDRISIYKHQGDHFTLLGRYSQNQPYNKFSDYDYPDSEGFISAGWRMGEFEINGAPPWSGKGSAYKAFMKRNCIISEDRLNKVSMKSRSFYIKTIDDDTSSEGSKGIIVFERLDPAPINTSQLNSLLATHRLQLLSMLRSMNSLTKKLDNH